MTAGSVDTSPDPREVPRAPVLVLGLGNLLLSDDAAGLHLHAALLAERGATGQVEFVDGGTQGLALLPYLSNRRAVLVLDAVGLGAEPGSVHVLRGPAIDALRVGRSTTAHEGNALELLATARLLGDDAAETVVVGVEPAHIATGIGLSPRVEAGLPAAIERARAVLQSMLRSRDR
jgi:hydrogenase maturation protease